MQKNKRGFTLIELLVVVLIISILAAVALPQYQIAVKKAFLAKTLPLVNTLYQAEDVYFLTHGTYTTNLTLLDIPLPSEGCTYTQTKSTGYYKNCPSDIAYGVYDGPTNAQAGNSTIRYIYYWDDFTSTAAGNYPFKRGDRACVSKGTVARKACQTLGKGTEIQRSSGWEYVYILDNN